ncbi:Peroxide-responsive repressor PerR [Koleobacter methoxysyntrophicus]|uniref:Peroxide-responsive repressor PerR n=1 Tax=Koleobacter methoxysyntrophicus TaxID=2751313 RepID=A0A8A0RKH2_9FIRM|nr:transcriptional repressor [Koleobacter methoxysyntrophicus]QSQ08931.1 Peroxide-responsive repressor PerR [Koleobacter methoxysyntrophicus]
MTRKKGFTRMTKQRRIILDVLRSTTSHPTADWLYEKVKDKIPNISLGTVYRNLNILKEMNEIMELNYGSTYSRFDGNPQNHYHFVCERCGRVFDIDEEVHREMDRRVEEKTGFTVRYHRMEFYGTCRECQNEKEEE